jgi:hypothetical protein
MGEDSDKPLQLTSLAWAAQYHYDAVESLKRYFGLGSPNAPARFDTSSDLRIAVSLFDYIEETEQRSSLAILTLIEALFRKDCQYRCSKKLKDGLSRAFRAKYRHKQQRMNLEEDIFDAWITHASDAKSLISELRGAFRFRHWLAHGRYWTPKLGRNYSFEYLYRLADAVSSTLPLCIMDKS